MSKQRLRTARGVLNEIDRFLATGNEEASKLWNVLSALRGPDGDSEWEKYATTSVLRQIAFPLTFKRNYGYDHYHAQQMTASMDGNALGTTDTDKAALSRAAIEQKPSSYHFLGHIKRAFEALNLKWNSINT